MQDSRIWGTWKSDARRTAREITSCNDISARRKKALVAFFGRLELKFTRTRCYSRLDHQIDVAPYTVVAKDATSVAIVSRTGQSGPVITHIHFEDGYFWMSLGNGRFREFFKRKVSKGFRDKTHATRCSVCQCDQDKWPPLR
jgi:hypothetical protein